MNERMKKGKEEEEEKKHGLEADGAKVVNIFEQSSNILLSAFLCKVSTF